MTLRQRELFIIYDFDLLMKVRVKGYFGDTSVMTADREGIILCTIEKANGLLNNFIVR